MVLNAVMDMNVGGYENPKKASSSQPGRGHDEI